MRNGAIKAFLDALSTAPPTAGIAILLRHLEDMVALNFTLFSDAEYQQLGRSVYTVSRAALSAETPALEQRRLADELRHSADGILEECRKARYLYLKTSLLEGVNLEVNQDKEAVQSSRSVPVPFSSFDLSTAVGKEGPGGIPDGGREK